MGSSRILSPEEIPEFLKASAGIDFSAAERASVLPMDGGGAGTLSMPDPDEQGSGVPREFLTKTVGLSVQQVTRLIGQNLVLLCYNVLRRNDFARSAPFAECYRAGST
ncbi:MAG: hypothetical protein U0Q18_00390 [Bryobacteraceae bacterium]